MAKASERDQVEYFGVSIMPNVVNSTHWPHSFPMSL